MERTLGGMRWDCSGTPGQGIPSPKVPKPEGAWFIGRRERSPLLIPARK